MNFKCNFILFLTFVCYFNHQIQAAHQQARNKSAPLLKQWLQAAQNGDLETTEQLIPKVDINAQDGGGNTALMNAIAFQRENIVKCLMQLPEINVNIKNEDSTTALMFASNAGNENIMKLLLQAHDTGSGDGAKATININAQDQNGKTALFIASWRGYENVVKLLLQVHGINITAQDQRGQTALTVACSFGHDNIVKILLPAFLININDRYKGDTVLIHSSRLGRENVVKMLLEVPGININAQGTDDKTALMRAEENKHVKIVKLIQDKIDELICKAFNAIKDDSIEIIKAVIAQIGIKIIDKDGDTLLHKAIKLKKLEIVRFLLLIDPTLLEINNKDGKDAIELSVGYPEIFEFIKTLVPSEKSCAHCSHESCTKKCSRCKKVFYCSSGCQKEHWNIHKEVCKTV